MRPAAAAAREMPGFTTAPGLGTQIRQAGPPVTDLRGGPRRHGENEQPQGERYGRPQDVHDAPCGGDGL